MKRIIVYKSATGFTKTYAEWLSSELGLECVTYKDSKKLDLNSYDEVIFGCSVFGGNLMEYSKIKEVCDKPLVVFAVGYTEDRNKTYAKEIAKNSNVVDPIFYMRGGVALKKLKFLPRMMFKMASKVKEDASFVSKEQLRDIIKYLKEE